MPCWPPNLVVNVWQFFQWSSLHCFHFNFLNVVKWTLGWVKLEKMLPRSPTCDLRGTLIASQGPLGFTALMLRLCLHCFSLCVLVSLFCPLPYPPFGKYSRFHWLAVWRCPGSYHSEGGHGYELLSAMAFGSTNLSGTSPTLIFVDEFNSAVGLNINTHILQTDA